MRSNAIRLVMDDEIAELVLNKPEKRNALSTDMWQSIPGMIDEAVQNQTTKVIIIHGGSAGAFAAGADISEFETIYATPEKAVHSSKIIADAIESITKCPKPVLAAIEGACVGGGVSLALAADLRIADQSAKFAITPGKLGLAYSVGDTRRLSETVGLPNAKDMLLTGRLIDSNEALQMGLINRLVPKGSSLSAAHQMAETIGALSQWSTRATKQVFDGLSEGWTNNSPQAQKLFLDGFAGEDFTEGFQAFLEKRPAKFTFS
ncbi:hypothetical protein HY29_03705 [Hyphomonas beringensis]|uniref:Enoyl-CoA hydratase n=1 Tax=Hyphomonas beringensis TaxID=1280946 RepID=A0A062TZ33_9PROT|nr:enoyl-CoA hydratase/isomerase family protein [Hyphomonas beringensis]KCZ53336.1 hypothetical protein HY29_03705 [Hyphomonas beringensis]